MSRARGTIRVADLTANLNKEKAEPNGTPSNPNREATKWKI